VNGAEAVQRLGEPLHGELAVGREDGAGGFAVDAGHQGSQDAGGGFAEDCGGG
jgi:hypothetical protein